MQAKLVRITTVPISLQKLIAGQMKFMGEHGFEVTMISSDFHEKEELELKENSKFIAVKMTRKISPLSDLVSLKQLIKEFKRIRPTIVHTHTPKAGFLGMLAAKITGVPIRLHTVAGLPLIKSKSIKRAILESVEKLTYSFATKVYPNSTELKNFILKAKFATEAKLKVIGNGSSNGIDTELFKRTIEMENQGVELRTLLGFKEENFVFLFVGRLVKDKGVEELVTAFDALSKKYCEIKLLLVGPEEKELDPLSSNCLQIIKSNKAIIATGFRDDVKPYLAISNVLTFPSYREGFPNVPMQAGCFDLPSIVTDINGCNEIIIEGENGLIIPLKDAEALMMAMEKIYLDKILYKNMASKARKLIVDRYEQQVVWDLILAEYNIQLLKNSNEYLRRFI